MKKILFNLSVILFIASCSQQKFAFRKTVPVDIVKDDNVKQPTKKNLQIEHKSEMLVLTPQTITPELTPVETEIAEASSEKVIPQQVAPEWKHTTPQPTEKATPKAQLKKMDGGNGMAIAGFILAILGWFVAGILLCTLGVVFSVIGLKSQRRGLAIAGLIIGILGVFLSIIAITAAT